MRICICVCMCFIIVCMNIYFMFRLLAIWGLFNKVEKSESFNTRFCRPSRALHNQILTESIPQVKIEGMVKGQLPTGNRSKNPLQRNQSVRLPLRGRDRTTASYGK